MVKKIVKGKQIFAPVVYPLELEAGLDGHHRSRQAGCDRFDRYVKSK